MPQFWTDLDPNTKQEIKVGLHTFIVAAIGVWAIGGYKFPSTKEDFVALGIPMVAAGTRAFFEMMFPSEPHIAPQPPAPGSFTGGTLSAA